MGEALEARVKGSQQPGRAGLGALMADPGRMPDDLLEVLDTALTLPGAEEILAAHSTFARNEPTKRGTRPASPTQQYARRNGIIYMF
jgi:hypothetical protein